MDERDDTQGKKAEQPELDKDPFLDLSEGLQPFHDFKHRFTHFPFTPACWVCRLANRRGRTHNARKEDHPHYEDLGEFGEHITVDFLIARRPKIEVLCGSKNMLLLYDLATGWVQAWPTTSRHASEVRSVLINATSIKEQLLHVYSDNADEFKKSCKDLQLSHSFSIPGDPQSNGLIENKVRLVKRGGRALLAQPG